MNDFRNYDNAGADLGDIGLGANPEQGFLNAMNLPRETGGFRSKTNWKYISDGDTDAIVMNPDNDAGVARIVGKAHALIKHGLDYTIAVVNHGEARPVYTIPSGPKKAVVNEYFSDVLTQQQYLFPWLNTTWVDRLTLTESKKKLLATHHTCPELETNWLNIFKHIPQQIQISHKDNVADIAGHSRALKVVDESLTDPRGWYKGASQRPTFYPILIKNPDVRGDENRAFGARNGIVGVMDDNGITMFACGIPSNDEPYLARPIAMGFQAILSPEYFRTLGTDPQPSAF